MGIKTHRGKDTLTAARTHSQQSAPSKDSRLKPHFVPYDARHHRVGSIHVLPGSLDEVIVSLTVCDHSHV